MFAVILTRGSVVKRVFAGLLGVLVLSLPQGALACLGPSMENYHLPSCTIPVPSAAESVSVLTATGWLPSASVHVGEPTEATVFATVRIEPSDMQHYLVLTSRQQIIWNIEGDVDSISRVIVLGAARLGPWAAGVIGVPREKISFTEPDLSALEAFMGTMQYTSCSRVSYACAASQWFGDVPSESVTFHPAPTQGRFEADAVIRSDESFRPLPWETETDAWPVTLAAVANLDIPVVVDPAQVVSPRPAQTYDQPTGQAGLDALRSEGALLAPSDPGFDAAVGAWAEAFSARYRTRFAPDFLFVPQVDYVVTRAVTLPADSPSSIYLLAAGVPLPEMNGNDDDYRTCFLVADTAGQPAERMRFDSPYCRDEPLGIPEPDKEIFYSAFQADTSERGTDCRQMELAVGAKIVVLYLTETGSQRYHDKLPREVAVDVAGDGPLVLYLHNTGGPVRWALSGSGVVQVFTFRPSDFQAPIMLNGALAPQAKLGIDREGCPWFSPHPLNAPGYLHLDEMMKTLLGQPIDRVVEVQIAGEDPVRIVID
jgi:hypothetical protein